MSRAYFNDKKRKYIVETEMGVKKEFPEEPTTFDYLKEGFEDQDTKAQLEALRKRRQSKVTPYE